MNRTVGVCQLVRAAGCCLPSNAAGPDQQRLIVAADAAFLSNAVSIDTSASADETRISLSQCNKRPSSHTIVQADSIQQM